jgi:hypothetical protein
MLQSYTPEAFSLLGPRRRCDDLENNSPLYLESLLLPSFLSKVNLRTNPPFDLLQCGSYLLIAHRTLRPTSATCRC